MWPIGIEVRKKTDNNREERTILCLKLPDDAELDISHDLVQSFHINFSKELALQR